MDKGGDLDWTDDLKIAFSVDFTGFVDNTTFTLAYNSGNLKASAGEKLGKIDLTAKISFLSRKSLMLKILRATAGFFLSSQKYRYMFLPFHIRLKLVL